uniref:Large ribosomal subunit protein uL24m n=1 Tax=Steinernema glaseri TaxID=37863 RepID=A0A1I7YYV1_9BILA
MCRLPRRVYADYDYARHFPKEYVEKMKRTVPRKVYDNRFGAPAITRWVVHPDDYEPGVRRPWEQQELTANTKKSDKYHGKKIKQEYYELAEPKTKQIPAEEWTFFPGDLVQVMVGKNKGSQGTISHVIRESNAVYVDGLHTILESEIEDAKKLGLKDMKRFKEQPLFVDKDQVRLVDPNDNAPCSAKWVLNDAKTEYVRISDRTGYEIPVPEQAKVTYDYVTADKYIEAEFKDTPSAKVLERTYVPKLMTFEDEIMKTMGIEEERSPKPTYWY